MNRIKTLLDKVLMDVVLTSRCGVNTRDYYDARQNIERGLSKVVEELEHNIKRGGVKPAVFVFGIFSSSILSSIVTYWLINGNF